MIPSLLNQKLLYSIYYKPEHPGGFSSTIELYNEAKKINPDITLKDVRYFLSNKRSFFLHQKKRIKFKRRKIITNGLFDLFQLDLVILPQLKEYNDDYQYLLTMIDCFSRKAYVEPLKYKTAAATLDAFKKILTTLEKKPVRIQTDGGGEFRGVFLDFLNKNNIKYYTTYSPIKCAIVERFNRTLLSIIYKYFTFKKSLRYIDVLHKIVDNYNNSRHRTLGLAPNQVNELNENIIWKKLYSKYLYDKKSKFDFEIGEPVLITKYKNIFYKGYKQNWKQEIFYIAHRLRTRPITYILKDKSGETILGSFYSQELQKIR